MGWIELITLFQKVMALKAYRFKRFFQKKVYNCEHTGVDKLTIDYCKYTIVNRQYSILTDSKLGNQP
jgi:hypothetical protein